MAGIFLDHLYQDVLGRPVDPYSLGSMSSFVQVAGRVSVHVVIDGMPFSASLANADGTTTCVEPVGRPFVKLELPGDPAPGGRPAVVFDIVNPLHARLPYRIVVCAGPGTP